MEATLKLCGRVPAMQISTARIGKYSNAPFELLIHI
jgi:hypothetical protein